MAPGTTVDDLPCSAQPGIEMKFAWIPPGTFLMGSPAHEPGRFDSEGPQHVVNVKAFALAKYPVTSEQFLNFLSATGYQRTRTDARRQRLQALAAHGKSLHSTHRNVGQG